MGDGISWKVNLFFLYSIICKPLTHERHSLIRYLTVAFVWLTSIGFVVPDMLYMRFTEHKGILSTFNCETGIISLIIPLVWALYSMIVPGFIIAIAYCFCAHALKANTVRHDNDRAMQLRSKQNSRIVRMFIFIVMIFLLLTMPSAIYLIYIRFLIVFNTSKVQVPYHFYLYHIIEFLAYSECCVNPIAFSKLHREINGYLRSITYRITRVNHHTKAMFAEMKQLTQTLSPRMDTLKDSQRQMLTERNVQSNV